MARYYNTESVLIISFGFRKEEFKRMEVPNFGLRYDMINLKQSLAVINFSSNAQMEIWVMKDYEKKTWVREKIVSTQLWVRDVVMDCWFFFFF